MTNERTPSFQLPPGQAAPSDLLTPPTASAEEDGLVKGLAMDPTPGLRAVAEARVACNAAVLKAQKAFEPLRNTDAYDASVYAAAIAAGTALKTAQENLEAEIEERFVKPARIVKQNADALMRAAMAGPSALRIEGGRLVTAYRKAEDDRKKAEQEAALAAQRRALEMDAWHEEALALDAVRTEETKILERAKTAADSGDLVRAEAILDTAPTLPPPPPPAAPLLIPPPPQPQVDRVDGEVRRKKRTGRIVNLAAFLRAVADGKVPAFDSKGKPVVEVRQSYLNDVAKTFGDKVGTIVPGVVCDETENTDFRSA